MRAKASPLTLSTEHRAAPSQDHIPLQLAQSGSTLALQVLEPSSTPPSAPPTPQQKVREALAQLREPAPVQHLRKLCGIRMAAVCEALEALCAQGEVSRHSSGYQLKLPFPVSSPLAPLGNGNGKP